MTYIILLNWNGWQDTNSCLNSLYENIKEDFKIVLLDNDSKNDSIEKITQHLQSKDIDFTYINETEIDFNRQEKNFILIQNNGNYGFAKGINIGLRYAIVQHDCTDIWLLNTDAVVDKNTLFQLKQKLYSNNEIGIVGSIIRYFDTPNSIQTIGGGRFFPLLGNGKLFYKNSDLSILKTLNFDGEIKKLDYIMGASMLVKKEVLDDIGFFDENFFLYAEELDLCTRAKESGYKLTVSKKSYIYHKDSASTKDKREMFFYLINKSNAYFVKKHYGYLFSLIALINNILINLFSNSKRKYIKDTLEGFWQGLQIK